MIYSIKGSYPQNLILAVNKCRLQRRSDSGTLSDCELNSDQLNGAEYILSHLSKKRRALILAHYRDNRTYADIATELNVSVSYVGQNIKSTLVRLSRQANFKYILYGYEGAKARDSEIADALTRMSEDAMKQVGISELYISERAYTALRRHGHIDTVYDLCNRTADDLLRIRNFGIKSLEEVQSALALYGLSLRSS